MTSPSITNGVGSARRALIVAESHGRRPTSGEVSMNLPTEEGIRAGEERRSDLTTGHRVLLRSDAGRAGGGGGGGEGVGCEMERPCKFFVVLSHFADRKERACRIYSRIVGTEERE